MSETSERPLGDHEVDKLLAPLLGTADSPPLLVLAVSGGVDSMALMHLTAEAVRRAGRGRVLVATVDHGLRPESAAEARFVAEEARRLGLAHMTLVWHGAKPATGIQEAARAARYRLLAEAICSEPAAHKLLVTAHTLDDQAETVLMRLARGSGVEGLSGIAEIERLDVDIDPRRLPSAPEGYRPMLPPVTVARPLLQVPKARLVATMRARGLSWVEDPSNESPAFERVRIRRARPVLQELGLTSEALARSARRLRSVRAAVAQWTLAALNDPDLVRIDPLGFVTVSPRVWRDGEGGLAEAVQLRLLAAVVRMVGGLERPLSLSSLEEVAHQISIGWHRTPAPSYAVTIGHTKIEQTGDCVSVLRETGRRPPEPLMLPPGASALWDNRFLVSVGAGASSPLEVRALGESGLRALRAEGHCPPSAPSAALMGAPGFFDGDRLVAAPSLAEHWRRADPDTAARHAPALEGPCISKFLDRPTATAIEAAD
ncbi:MAG: tRNA lysidine(34) synthetase TilS [Pseudomonadota bacterium]